MKAHINVDAQSRFIYTVVGSAAKEHDAKMMSQLIREGDQAVFGGKVYV